MSISLCILILYTIPRIPAAWCVCIYFARHTFTSTQLYALIFQIAGIIIMCGSVCMRENTAQKLFSISFFFSFFVFYYKYSRRASLPIFFMAKTDNSTNYVLDVRMWTLFFTLRWIHAIYYGKVMELS